MIRRAMNKKKCGVFLLMQMILRHNTLKVKNILWLLILMGIPLWSTSCLAISIVVDPSTIAVAREGDIFTVKILLTDYSVPNDVFGVDFRLTYKPDFLKLVDASGNEAFTIQSLIPWKGGFSGDVNIATGVIEYSGINMTTISCQQDVLTTPLPITLAEMSFKALKSGKTTISFDTSVNPTEVINSPTVAYLLSVSADCAGVVIPTPKNADVQIGDFTPPTISNIQVPKITRSTAAITWLTNENASSQIQYGLTEGLGISSPVLDEAVPVSSHLLTLTGLFPDTLYFYKIVSKDAAGNIGTAETKSFKTNLVDQTPPVITHEPVLYATEGIEQEITAHVVDDDVNNVPSVSLYYKSAADAQFVKVSMTTQNSVDFTAAIPAGAVTTANVNYYIEAMDVSANKAAFPDNAPASLNTILVSTIFDVVQISGNVKNQSTGKGEPDVKVRAVGSGVSVLTDSNGDYTLKNLPIPKVDPSYDIEASKDGFLASRGTYNFGTKANVDFVLQKAGILSGTLVNSRTCQPVSLMTVSLKDDSGNTFEGITDLKGNYKVTNFKLGIYTASFKKTGYKPDPSTTLQCSLAKACLTPSISFDDTNSSQTCNYLVVPKPISSITVTPDNIFLAPGDKVQFKASLATEDGENAGVLLNPTLVWSVSTDLLGNITNLGEFTAGGQSIAGFVQVQSEGVTGLATVNVQRELAFRNVSNDIKPFNPRRLENGIEIRYELTQDPFIVLVKIYTMTGKMIRTLVGQKGTDTSTGVALWDGKDDFGNDVYNGVYIYQIMAKNKNGTAYSKAKAIAILK